MEPARRKWLALAAALAAGTPLRGLATGAMKRVGVLGIEGGGTYSYWKQEFAAEFRKHGFVEGRNLQLVWFGVPAEGPKGPFTYAELREGSRRKAADMAAAGLDCMVANGEPHTRLLHEASRTIPTVVSVPDPVALGFARTIARPGGNVTGLHDGHEEIAIKTVELFRKLLPGIKCVGWIGSENFRRMGDALETTSKSVGLRFHSVSLRGESAADEAAVGRELAVMRREGCVAANTAYGMDLAESIGRQALAHQVALTGMPPKMEGNLFTYTTRRLPEEESVRRVPAIVARVLRGEKPADIPFEGPSRYHLAINLKTAARLRITVPPDVMILANEVIS